MTDKVVSIDQRAKMTLRIKRDIWEDLPPSGSKFGYIIEVNHPNFTAFRYTTYEPRAAAFLINLMKQEARHAGWQVIFQNETGEPTAQFEKEPE